MKICTNAILRKNLFFLDIGQNDLDQSDCKIFKPFSANLPLMDKPGSWFVLAKCLKNTCGRVTQVEH